jgi:hypothetical protein
MMASFFPVFIGLVSYHTLLPYAGGEELEGFLSPYLATSYFLSVSAFLMQRLKEKIKQEEK